MKIVIDGRAIKQTGIGRYIEETTAALLRQDKSNHYILLVRDIDRAQLKPKASNLELISANYLWYTFAEQLKGPKILKRLKGDLAHFPNFNIPLLYKGRFVVTIHDLIYLNFKNINPSKTLPSLYHFKDLVMRFVLSQAVHRSTHIISPSNFVREQVIEHFKISPKKITTIYEAAEPPRAKPRVSLDKFNITKPYVLYVGAAYPHKNLERLILAFGKLTTDYMLDYQLVIAGRKSNFHDSLEQHVKEADLGDKIIFTDYVTDSELAGLYNSATIYSFPSLSEGFGLPGLEAMSHGLPVASSNATCLPEIYGEAAAYYNPKDVNDMARVMAELIAHPDQQEELRNNGYKQVKKYSWVECARQTLAVYKKSAKK